MAPIPAVHGGLPEHYLKLGLSQTTIEPWEDGLRTDPNEIGVWEWWYFDARLSNGAKLVVTFLTKDFSSTMPGLDPRVTIQLDTPDGRSLDVRRTFTPGEFAASKDRCDVSMGKRETKGEGEGQGEVQGEGDADVCYFRGDDSMRTYEIKARAEGVEVEVHLASATPPWRPRTGHMLYGESQADYSAWLAAVPHGSVAATYRVPGLSGPVTVSGEGYHDHNWGNVLLSKVVNHWYWGRGSVGPYAVFSAATAHERAYGGGLDVSLMLARDGVVVAEDGGRATFAAEDVETDELARRPVADLVRFEYRDGEGEGEGGGGGVRYVLEYERKKTVMRRKLIDQVAGLRWAVAKLFRFDGCDLRFSGTLKLKKYEKGELVEEYENEASWELMWFGKAYEE